MLLRFLALSFFDRIRFVLMSVFFSFFIPVMLLAQEAPGDGLSLENFGSLAGLVAGIVFITGLWKQYVSEKNNFIVAIVVSTIACIAGYYFQLGVFIGLAWWGVLLYDIGIILIFGNKVSIDVVLKLFEAIKIAPKPTQTKSKSP